MHPGQNQSYLQWLCSGTVRKTPAIHFLGTSNEMQGVDIWGYEEGSPKWKDRKLILDTAVPDIVLAASGSLHQSWRRPAESPWPRAGCSTTSTLPSSTVMEQWGRTTRHTFPRGYNHTVQRFWHSCLRWITAWDTSIQFICRPISWITWTLYNRRRVVWLLGNASLALSSVTIAFDRYDNGVSINTSARDRSGSSRSLIRNLGIRS